MKVSWILFLAGSLVLFDSCIDDAVNNTFLCEEEGVFWGDVEFSETTNSFWSYSQGQKLIFKNALGEEITLVQKQYEDNIQLTQLETVCGSPQLPVHEFNSVRAERRSVIFEDESGTLNIFISLNITPTYDGADVFNYFEVLNISSSRTYMYFATDKSGDMATPSYLWSGNYNQIDTVLLGETFEDVYHRSNIAYSGFFSKEKGLVAFYDNSFTFYVLDRIE